MKNLIRRVAPTALWHALQRLKTRYREFRYRRSVVSYPRRVVEHAYGSVRLKLTIADPEGESWYDHDWPTLPEIELLAHNRLKSGATAFEIGAHQGVVAMLLADRVGASGRIIAVDPHSLNVELIGVNAALNGIGHIVPMLAAGGALPGEVLIGVHLNSPVINGDGRASASKRSVRVVTVDELKAMYGHPAVVFVDVEGFEHSVLAGGKELLKLGETDWFVEVHVNAGLENFGHSPADILAFFDPNQYSLMIASEGEREFVALESGRHLLTDRFFLLAFGREAGS